jgi:hypothetical protein
MNIKKRKKRERESEKEKERKEREGIFPIGQKSAKKCDNRLFQNSHNIYVISFRFYFPPGQKRGIPMPPRISPKSLPFRTFPTASYGHEL